MFFFQERNRADLSLMIFPNNMDKIMNINGPLTKEM